jgi:hypothetical protein
MLALSGADIRQDFGFALGIGQSLSGAFTEFWDMR